MSTLSRVSIFAMLSFLMSGPLMAEAANGGPATIGAATSTEPSAQTAYQCHKAERKMKVDGVLDDEEWGSAPAMPFVGMVDGSKPPFETTARMLWDDEYLYCAFYFEDQDIRGIWGLDEGNCSDELKSAILTAQNVKPDSPWGYMECSIMYVDKFAKILLDPDGDGTNYLEFQVNPLNNVFDAWYKQGFREGKWGNRDRFPSLEWKCPGLLSATRIDGTINAPQDVDNGWSLEIAVPWSSLGPFTKGSCPPKAGDVWGAHLGRIYRDREGGKNEYWTWPLIGLMNSHLPDTYGKIVFQAALPASAPRTPFVHAAATQIETPRFERLFVWGYNLSEDPAYIDKLADTGVTDIIATGSKSRAAVELYTGRGIRVYPVVTILPQGWQEEHAGGAPPLQKMSDEEVAVKNLLIGAVSSHRQVTSKSGENDAPADWNVTDKQRAALDSLTKANFKDQAEYQWGGEEQNFYFGGTRTGVLMQDLLCFNSPDVKESVKGRIKDALAAPGVSGVAFDFFGYQNYRACYCPICEALYKEYCAKENADPTAEATRNAFSRDRLVEFNNEMADYARSLKPDAVVVNHVYPVFMPEPLYGNRLKVDFCGQTAAWYFCWDPWRIEKYSKIISGDQAKYWKGAKGVAFIGYYHLPMFPVKSPEKVESELRAIWRGGPKYLMECGLEDLMKNEDVRQVFKKFCRSAD